MHVHSLLTFFNSYHPSLELKAHDSENALSIPNECNQNKDIWISRYSIYSFKPGEDNKERFETFYHRLESHL